MVSIRFKIVVVVWFLVVCSMSFVVGMLVEDVRSVVGF